jgi:membrane fusion protein, multidrug efflux system
MKRSHLIAAGVAVGVGAWIMSGQVDGDLPAGDQLPVSQVEAEAVQAKPLARVRVRKIVAQERISELVLFGRTEAARTVDLRAETMGRVTVVETQKGNRVKKGDVILRLAIDERAARLNEAKALVDQRRIAYEAAQQLSRKHFRSKVKLAEEKAALESAKAGLTSIRVDLARTVIRAPFDGVVDDVSVEIGDYISPGGVIARVIDLDPVLIVGEVAERDVADIILGAPADAHLVSGERAEGTIRYVSKVGTSSTRTFRVEVAVDNPHAALVEGLTAELRLPVGKVLAHRISPAVLTLSDQGIIGVKVVNNENTVEFKPVELVADTSDGIWLGGLPEHLTLITVGQEFVRQGQKVVPVLEEDVKRTTEEISKGEKAGS